MKRRSGLLLHPLSLPGATGGGTLDGSVDTFLDFCRYHHQTVWQVLPLGPTGYGDSPYQSFSTHAGNPYLISLEQLEAEGLATPQEVQEARIEAPDDKIDYCQLYEVRRPVLTRVARAFASRAKAPQRQAYQEFCQDQAHWLDDYALYMTIKEEQQKSWQDWPTRLRKRQAKALDEVRATRQAELESQKVIQWFFAHQWETVRKKARAAGIQILGDIPIFVALDSADAWANPELFQFDKERRPEAVAGVPPDYFSADGQLWGNPLYRWERHEKERFAWWKERMRSALRLYDMVRIDHFRGFAGYWSVPAGAENARGGAWKKAPGDKLFKTLQAEFPELPVVAEDLGDITPDVHALRDKFQLPGMKVLQFAFSAPDNEFLPHHYRSNFVVYTGTHDNDTTAGWYSNEKLQAEQRFFRHYLGLGSDTDPTEAVRQMIRLAMRSVAQLAIIPFQDVLALDSTARMNTPSVAADNWQWRLTSEQLEQRQDWLKETTWLTARA
jgi:4-alpha-glucanotransferase